MKLEFESNTTTLPFAGVSSATETSGAANVSQMLQLGIKAAQEGNRAEARQLLFQVTEADSQNENAWLWLASISEYPEELLVFLNNILTINPYNERAVEWSKATKSMLAKSFVQRGVDASNEANMDLARQCFSQAIVHDSQNEMAWLWMASISDSTEEKISHLQKVLEINPKNETAHASLQSAKNQIAESLLQKANRAAISGERAEANEMLQEVLNQAPDLEEAWILKAYLAESFSEKITAFEKVLALNPDNDAAISGLASLKAMMAKTETLKAEQQTMVANLMQLQEAAAEDNSPFTEEDLPNNNDDEMDAQPDSPTEELQFPPDFVEPNNQYFEDSPSASEQLTEDEESANEEVYPAEYIVTENAAEDFGNQSFSEQTQSQTIPTLQEFQENLTAEQAAPETNDYETNFSEQNETNFVEQNFESTVQTTAPTAAENSENKFLRTTMTVETNACPFCYAENDSNAYVCGTCRTILTLTDLEMLLAHTDANREVLSGAVAQMENDKAERDFESHELKTLALAHINLKNLRQGILLLQAALRMNPNDVMLGSQINSLKIRLLEIEDKESNLSSMTRGRKIMVVDDSATVRKLISGKLEKAGHEVFCAVDGLDALEQIKALVPDLILLDIMMPQMDGYQVCKLIRSNEATRDVPIVMISGKDGFFDKVRGRMSGTTGYITKPFGPETLMKTIESYMI
jgi:twitching motility two-component system response regulator PilG